MLHTHLRRVALLTLVLVTTGLGGCAWLYSARDERPGVQLSQLKAVDGMRVEVFASDLPRARHMALGEPGTLYVGSFAGNVYAVRFDGGKRVSQRVAIQGLRNPSGLAYKDGALFVADRTRVVRYDNIATTTGTPPAPVVVLNGLPDSKRHDAHAMRFGPDGKLYVSIGAPCDTCEVKGDEFGVIVRVNADGSGREVVARGIRNSVGFDWHRTSQELWFTDNGQDSLGTDKPNDELNRVTKVGEHFGFPHCHDTAIIDPKFGAGRSCGEFTAPAGALGPRVAALGMTFNAADSSVLVARHGSHPPARVGYDVVRLATANGRAMAPTPFLTGFLNGTQYWGRPVDVLVLSDGSTLVSDDLNGVIYRVFKAP